MFMFIGIKIMRISLLKSLFCNLWTILFLVLPFIYLILLSITCNGQTCFKYEYNLVQFSIYLGHYIHVFEYNIYIYAILNSLYIALCTTCICIILSYPTSYFISMMCSKTWQTVFKTMIIIACWLSFLIRVYSWIYILDYYYIEYGSYTIILGGVSCFLPYAIFAVHSLVEQIDRSIIEAAQDLGAKDYIIFTQIIIPLTKKGIINVGGFVFIPMLGEYFIAPLLGGGSSVVIGRIIQNAIIHNRIEFIAAYILCILVILSPYIHIYRKHTK